jgi:hypothetical protein
MLRKAILTFKVALLSSFGPAGYHSMALEVLAGELPKARQMYVRAGMQGKYLILN